VLSIEQKNRKIKHFEENMITSVQNSKVKNIIKLLTKKKERQEQRLFVQEGLRFVQETPHQLLREIYVSESFLSDESKRKELEKGLATRLPMDETDGMMEILLSDGNTALYSTVTDEIMKKMTDTETPQGVCAVSEMPSYALDDILETTPSQLLILEDIQDPGNLGTMIRTAEGAGTTGIIMTKNTVDIFSPKASRATMGSLFRVPFTVTENLTETLKELKIRGVKTYAAYLGGEKTYLDIDCKKNIAFLIGNEGNGLKPETADMTDEIILIPMEGQLESLNAAMAAGILMYESHRQRWSKN
jgi:TrmH family RNA methyltransferase